jgi:hypothetical protein
MSGTYFCNKEDSTKELQYGATDTEDTNTTVTSNEKYRCRKRSTTESDSEGTPTLPPKKKVFISTSSAVKHWQSNFNQEFCINQLLHL